MFKIRAAVLREPRKLSIEEVKKPVIGEYDVLVRVRATALCGTDVDIYNGKGKARLPVIPGHESAGEVEEVGSKVTSVKPGERVVIDPTIACGQCFWCKKGLRNLCPNGGLMGREMNGTFAEYVSVPESNVYKLPDGISFEEATIVNTLATVLHSHRLVNVFPGDSIAVMGCGFTGLLHIQVAKLRGARPIIAITRSTWKLDLAGELGADVKLRSGYEDVVSRVKEITEGRGVDLAIETAGSAATLKECVELIRPGGKILAFGISDEKAGDLSLFPFYYKQLSIIGSRAMLPEDWNPSIQLIATRRIDVKPLITHKVSFEELQKAFDMFEDRNIKSIRIVVTQ